MAYGYRRDLVSMSNFLKQIKKWKQHERRFKFLPKLQ